MILRKPYAFLIKYFKLLHLILVAPMIFLLIRTNLLLEFVNEYLASPTLIIGGDFTTTLFESSMFILNFMIIIVAITLFAVMYYKKKPLIYYIFTILVYLILFILYNYAYSVVGQMQSSIIDTRVVRALRDFLMMIYFVQLLNIVQTAIRATGFDIRKFDFKTDLQELNVSSEDNEEFEFELKVNTNKITNEFKKSLRFMKYVYIENRLIVDCIGLALIIVATTLIYLSFSANNKYYGQDTYFNTNNFTIKIDDAYLVNKSYTGTLISEESVFVVVRADIKSQYQKDLKLNTGLVQLVVDDEVYYHSKDNRHYFSDIGNVYNNYVIPLEDTEYLFVYEIPAAKQNGKMYFRYLNNFEATGRFESKYLKVRLDVEDLTKSHKAVKAEYSKNLVFDNTILLKSNLNISSIDIAESFEVQYDYCVSDSECYNSVEIVRPQINTNYDKALVRIKGSVNIAEGVETEDINSLYGFLNKYGVIEYVINGKTYTQRITSSVSTAKVKTKNSVFIEINKNILNAERVVLKVNIRNSGYEYVIK